MFIGSCAPDMRASIASGVAGALEHQRPVPAFDQRFDVLVCSPASRFEANLKRNVRPVSCAPMCQRVGVCFAFEPAKVLEFLS